MPFDFSGGPKFDGFTGLSLLLLVGGIAVLALWVLVFAVRWWASLPKAPGAGPETTELGPEPPAVVNFLVNRWKVSHTALPATLIDLAARDWLEIQQLDRDHFVVRIRGRARGDDHLTNYEQQVMDLVRERATGGSAPVEVLMLGEPAEAEAWWKRFRGFVVSDARDLGLARQRWRPEDFVLFGVLLAAGLGLVVLALGTAHFLEGVNRSATSEGIGRWDSLWAGVVAWVAVLISIGASQDVRDTPAGRQACARWLGVRTYFRASKAFDELPPAAVEVWERNLSQAVALGVAHEAARQLPFEEEDPEAAWSRYGGTWHELRINYPERFDWGKPPRFVLLSGLGRTAFWGVLTFYVLPVVARLVFDAGTDVLAQDSSFTGPAGRDWRISALVGVLAAIFAIGGLYLLARTLGGLIRLWRGLRDFQRTIQVEGEVVKVRGGRIAVDDGTSEEVDAWTPPPGSPGLGRGMKVRATMSPHLKHVTRVEVLSGAPPDAPVAALTVPAETPPN